MKDSQFKTVVNYIVEYSSIFSLTPWRNSIQLFSEAGYKINVYQLADRRIQKYKTDLDDKYTLVEVRFPEIIKYILYIIKLFFRSLKYIGLKEISTFGDGVAYLVRVYYFIMTCLLKNKCGEHEIFIGGDPAGLIAANYLARRKKGALIYWSLELFIEKDLKNFGLKFIKRRERKCNQNALYTVDFGDLRCKVLQEENKLNSTTMISIPNSQIGQGKVLRNYYFNDKFNIPRNKKIMLHAGILYSPSIKVKDIFLSIPDWPDDYILILHTHQTPYPMSGFSIPQENMNRNIFLSNDPVPFDQLDVIYSSCDIGLMVHGSTNADSYQNHYFSDLSVGKMFHHFKVGVPIIVRRLPGYVDLIEGNHAGVCIDQPSDILPAIKTILNKHNDYRLNSVKLHDKLRFEVYHKKLIDKVGELYG